MVGDPAPEATEGFRKRRGIDQKPKRALLYMIKIKRLCRSRAERKFLKIWSLYNVGNGLYRVFTTAKSEKGNFLSSTFSKLRIFNIPHSTFRNPHFTQTPRNAWREGNQPKTKWSRQTPLTKR